MVRSFAEAIERATGSAAGRPLAVVAPEKPGVLDVLHGIRERGVSDFLLVGERSRIEAAWREARGGGPLPFEVAEERGEPAVVCRAAVTRVHRGEARGVMKGSLPSAAFLAGLIRSFSSAERPFLSHALFFEHEGRLVLDTDGGVNPYPDLAQKARILANAVCFVRERLGVERPKVAVMAAVERVVEEMPETVEAKRLAEMGRAGALGDCIVDGPLALDNVLSEGSRREKGIASPALPGVDVLLMPNLVAGNILGKCITYMTPCPVAGLVLGCPFPVVMLSRTDKPETRMNSVALSAL